MLDYRSLVGTEDRLELILRGGHVKRYHAEDVCFTQTVGEHTWRVLAILLHLWPDASLDLLKAAIYHDVPEGIVGDAPAPVKRHPILRQAYADLEAEIVGYLGVPNERDLGELDYARLKCADYLELVITCAAHPGNDADRIVRKGIEYVTKASSALSVEETDRIEELFRRLNKHAR